MKTGRGRHYYFLYPKDTDIRNFTRRYPGIDLRGEGGYVLAPPSLHPSGKIYEWVIKPSVQDMANLPEWVINSRKEIKIKEKGWVEELLKGVDKGIRNDTCTRLAGHFFTKGLSLEEIREILLTWNQKNNPPLEREEVIRTVESIWKRDQNRQEDKTISLVSPEELARINKEKLPFISNFLEIASERTDAPKEYHIASAIATLSAIIGPSVVSPIMTGLSRPLRLNFYIILIGESSLYRKSTAIYFALSILKKIPGLYGSNGQDPKDTRYGLLIPQNFSPEALFNVLSNRDGKACFLIKDEITGLLKAFKKQYMAGAKEDLIKAYDGDRIERTTLSRGYIIVEKPYLTWLSATTPDGFADCFEELDIYSGLLPRFLIVYPDGHGKGKEIRYISTDLADDSSLLDLQEQARIIYNYWQNHKKIYWLSKWGLERFNQLIFYCEWIIDQDPKFDKTYARLPWQVYKLAMLLQATEEGIEQKSRILIRDEYLIAAIKIVQDLSIRSIRAQELVGMNQIEKTIEKIEQWLKNAPKPKAEIMRKFHLSSEFTNKIAQTMLERNTIQVIKGHQGVKGEKEIWKLTM